MSERIIWSGDEHRIVVRKREESPPGVTIAYQSKDGANFVEVDNVWIPQNKVAQLITLLKE